MHVCIHGMLWYIPIYMYIYAYIHWFSIVQLVGKILSIDRLSNYNILWILIYGLLVILYNITSIIQKKKKITLNTNKFSQNLKIEHSIYK